MESKRQNQTAADQKPLSLYGKLSAIRKAIGPIPATAYNDFHRFWYRSADSVLIAIKDLLDTHKIVLYPRVENVKVSDHTTKDGKHAYFTEIKLIYTWLDCESGQTLDVPWYAQGLDDSEKGVGKAYTYGEKYFILKFFNVSTSEDDPDNAPKKRKFTNKQKDFDFLKAIKELKPFIDEPEYYKYLGLFKRRDGKTVEHSNEIQPDHREMAFKFLNELKARNERFVNILNDKARTIAKDALQEILMKHAGVDTYVNDKKQPVIIKLDIQKAIIADIENIEKGAKKNG